MASSPDPNTTGNNRKEATVLSRVEKTVTLHDWWLIKAENTSDGKRLAVGGSSSIGNRAGRIFSSAPILRRYDLCTLETVDGVTVFIRGCINKTLTHENGISFEVCNLFLIGFPFNWEDFCHHCGEELIPRNIFGRSDECSRPKNGKSREITSEVISEDPVVDSHVQMNAEVSDPLKEKSSLHRLEKLKYLSNRLMAMGSSERKRRNYCSPLPRPLVDDVVTLVEKKSCAAKVSSLSNVDHLGVVGKSILASQNDAPMISNNINCKDVTAEDDLSRNCLVESSSDVNSVNPTAANMASSLEAPKIDSFKNSDREHLTRRSAGVVSSCDKMDNHNEPACSVEARKSERLKRLKGTGNRQENLSRNCLIESGSDVEGVNPSEDGMAASMEDPVDYTKSLSIEYGFEKSGGDNLNRKRKAVSACSKIDSDNGPTSPVGTRRSYRLNSSKATADRQDKRMKSK